MLVTDILTQILLTNMTYISLPILQTKISVYRKCILFGMSNNLNFQMYASEWSMNNNVVSKFAFTPIKS